MNMSWIKSEIQRSIKSKKTDIERLESISSVVAEYEEAGWTPDIYKDFVVELSRLGMCVVHRSVLTDVQVIIGWLDREQLLRDQDCPHEDGDLTINCVERVEAAIEQSFRALL